MAESIIELKTILFAVIGGILPAILWLWFWLGEDSKKPEPKGLIILAFFAGMVAVPVVFPLESAACSYFTNTLTYFSSDPSTLCGAGSPVMLVILWSTIEELAKYGFAFAIALRSKFFDEPVDAVIYMITVALGFSAMENFLFFIGTVSDHNIITAVLNSHLRFMGATLLHTITSSFIGIAIALSFYKPKNMKKVFLFVGIIVAILLHTLFNLTIINTETTGESIKVFSFFWIIVLLIILFFEKIKSIKKPAATVAR